MHIGQQSMFKISSPTDGWGLLASAQIMLLRLRFTLEAQTIVTLSSGIIGSKFGVYLIL
jgi:hypothetical protein